MHTLWPMPHLWVQVPICRHACTGCPETQTGVLILKLLSPKWMIQISTDSRMSIHTYPVEHRTGKSHTEPYSYMHPPWSSQSRAERKQSHTKEAVLHGAIFVSKKKKPDLTSLWFLDMLVPNGKARMRARGLPPEDENGASVRALPLTSVVTQVSTP